MIATPDNTTNADPAELAKFSALASQWWDLNGKFRPLHDINPLRLSLVDEHARGVKGKRAIDIGCGGGIASEGLARMGAQVTGIDMAGKALAVAKLHALESNTVVDYREMTAEAAAEQFAATFDVVTCLEMLEHVPDPASVVRACAALAKPGATLAFSTISRTPKAYAMAVLGAEYVLGLLPKGTHDYAKFIKPSELVNFTREAGLELVDLRGMDYSPFSRLAKWIPDTTVNYIIICRKP
ncbi:MAG TPA: bifunctional 2-polyprenyl-6-hydroxyphenol methylase/3-demethylubiquinol 3-O-methyltransferase UbiG [Casimicrobium sp.]|jgi:2-polyprenyl-6-hydroxyphenyl methylase/3-demethylubiquinone-9 3-methyltransferase|nr:bifunctional 2-polyprenyl-6-hydroxyphenol methylase/3-demethylubiquinol 3-O-methyltransferase UbiG [Casimicrobium sp.]